MIGYTVPSWYGYGGWGMLDYFLEQPGRFTLAEAFFANQQALLHRLATCFPGDEMAAVSGNGLPPGSKPSAEAKALGLTEQDCTGLLYDRDVVAFYGDPAWEARMATAAAAWEQSLAEKDGRVHVRGPALRGKRSFQPININGSQRGGRPIVQLLPHRIEAKSVKVVAGAEMKPLVTDNFLLLPLPRDTEPKAVYRLVFHGKSHRKVNRCMSAPQNDLLRRIPSVEILLEAAEKRWPPPQAPRRVLVAAVRGAAAAARQRLQSNGLPGNADNFHEFILADARPTDRGHARDHHYCRAVNATGIILHTGLGRAVLPPQALRQIARRVVRLFGLAD